METSFQPIGAFSGVGHVSYSPQKAPQERGFGEWEVHPNKVPVNANGTLSLEWNGEYLAIGSLENGDGTSTPYILACCGVKPSLTAIESAEMICALRNGDKPTRVIDYCGNEYVSRHSATALESRINK